MASYRCSLVAILLGFLVHSAQAAFEWKTGDFGPCSYECEPFRTRTVDCWDTSTLMTVSDAFCTGLTKPDTTTPCAFTPGTIYDFEFGSDDGNNAFRSTIFYPRVDEAAILMDGVVHVDWTYLNGPTDTANTGPDVDHTIGDSTGHYYYVEASAPRSNSETYFESPIIDAGNLADSADCSVTFHLYGRGPASDLNPLRTEFVDCATFASTPLDTYPVSTAGMGKYGTGATAADRNWEEETVTLPSGVTGKVRVRWIHERNAGDSDGDWAIDDISFSAGCVPPSPSPTPSQSPSVTPSATPSHTASASHTPSLTATPSGTGTLVPSPSPSASISLTSSRTSSISLTSSATPSPSPSHSHTATHTPTASASPSHSPSHSPSATATTSATPSHSASPSVTPTHSASHTVTPTHTSSHSRTASPSSTHSSSSSASHSASPSATYSATISPTATNATLSLLAASQLSPFVDRNGYDDWLFIWRYVLIICALAGSLCCCLWWFIMAAARRKKDDDEPELDAI